VNDDELASRCASTRWGQRGAVAAVYEQLPSYERSAVRGGAELPAAEIRRTIEARWTLVAADA